MRVAAKKPGTCVHCGCTEEKPCRFSRWVSCGWFTTSGGRFVCTDRACIEKETEYLFAQIEEKQKKAEKVLCP
jgi:hypothetical protein